MEILVAIEQLGAVNALKQSFFVYPMVNAVHIMAIGAVLTATILIDLRMLGFFRTVEPGVPVALLRRIALSAFAIAVLTGVTMFAVRATEYVFNPAFLLKMGLIPLAAVNFLLFLRLGGKAAGRAKADAIPAPARFLAALSIILWLGVVICGRFIGFL